MAVAALALSLLLLIFFSIMMFRMMRIRMTTMLVCMAMTTLHWLQDAAAVAVAPGAMEEGCGVIINSVHSCCYAEEYYYYYRKLDILILLMILGIFSESP